MKKIRTSRLHSLECEIEKEISLILKFFPGTGLKNRILRCYLSKVSISDSNRISKFYFRSKASIEREKIRHFSEEHRLRIIHPCSQLWTSWTFLFYCLTTFSIYELPMRVSFNYIESGHIKHLIWMWIGFALDTMYLINMMLNFCAGYILEADNEVVINPWRITLRYLKFGFPVDLLSSLPMDVIYYLLVYDLNGTSSRNYHLLLNAFHLIKLLRLASLGNYMNCMARIYGISRYVPYRIFATYVACLVLHIAACTQFLTSVVRKYNNEKMQTWENIDNLWQKSTAISYIYALHRGTSLALGANVVQVEPLTVWETLLAVLTRIAGAVSFAVFIGHCVHIISSAHRSKQESAEKMKLQLQSYLKDKQVPSKLKKKVFEYFDFHYPETYYKEEQVEEALSKSLLQDILQNQAKNIEEKVPLFRGLPNQLLREIVSRMTTEHFWPNDVIIQANTIGDTMFFLSKGTVAVFTPTGKEVCHLQDGAYFGEIALIKKSKRTASVMAVEPCETLCLHRDDFKDVVHPASALWQCIAAEAHTRLETLERREQQLWRTTFHGSLYENGSDN